MTALIAGTFAANAQQAWHTQNNMFTTASRGINDFTVVDSNVVFATAYDGSGGGATLRDFTKTTDGGATWKATKLNATGLGATHGLANLSAVDKDTLYAAVYPAGSSVAPQGVYKSNDAGTTWKKVSTGAFTNASSSFINVVHFFDAANGIALGDPAGGYFEIYTTNNYGNTWTRVPTDSIPLTPVSGEYGTVGYYGTFDSTIIYPTNFGNVLVSKDMGYSWKLATTSLSGVANTAMPSITASSKDDFWAVLNNADSASSTIIFSIDGGLSWNSTGADTLGKLVQFSSIEHVPGTLSTFFLTAANATSGITGSAYTEDGVTWVNIDSAIQHSACQFADINNGWSGGFNTATTASGGIFKWGSVRVAQGVNSNKVENFEVYPNPSNGTFYVKANVKGASSVKVLDFTGRVVFSKEYPTQSLLYTAIDLSNQAQGLYMVEVREGNNVSVQKIVKQ